MRTLEAIHTFASLTVSEILSRRLGESPYLGRCTPSAHLHRSDDTTEKLLLLASKETAGTYHPQTCLLQTDDSFLAEYHSPAVGASRFTHKRVISTTSQQFTIAAVV